jgi:hypothetical protein
MRRLALFVGGFLFLAMVGQANATTACYSWSCNESTHACTFNSSCSSWTGNLFRFSWDFGDGSTALTSSSTVNHTYGNVPYPDVTLTVIPLSSSTASVTCEIVSFNNVGPARATYGNCP